MIEETVTISLQEFDSLRDRIKFLESIINDNSIIFPRTGILENSFYIGKDLSSKEIINFIKNEWEEKKIFEKERSFLRKKIKNLEEELNKSFFRRFFKK